MILVYVALGGAFGSVCRYLMMSGVGHWLGREFPYGTLMVNILGSFLLGVMIGLIAAMLPRGRELHALVAVGALGGFTTFSTFAMDIYILTERGQMMEAALYTAASVGISVLAFFAGMWMFRTFAW